MELSAYVWLWMFSDFCEHVIVSLRWLLKRIPVPTGVFAAGHPSPLGHNKRLCHLLSIHRGTPLRSIAKSVSGVLFCKTQNAYDPMRCKCQYPYPTNREAEDGEGGSFAGGHPGPPGRGLALHFVWLWKPRTSSQGGCRGPESLSAVTARGGSILELTTGIQSSVAKDVWRRGLKKQTHTSTWLSGRDGALWEDPFSDGRISRTHGSGTGQLLSFRAKAGHPYCVVGR